MKEKVKMLNEGLVLGHRLFFMFVGADVRE